jgi:holliday junction DNA helicase RuvA
MYTALNGHITHCGYDPITNEPTHSLDVHGVIYELRCTERHLAQLKLKTGETLLIHTHMVVKEDELSLIGFATPEERDMFRILIGASGVGAKVALGILNHFEPHDLVTAVLNEDIKRITGVKGVGPKVAKRIVLDVKEKLKMFAERASLGRVIHEGNQNVPAIGAGEALAETLAVLESLGYEAHEVEAVLSALQGEIVAAELASMDAETLLRQVLKRL